MSIYEQPELPDWIIDLQNDLEEAQTLLNAYHALLNVKSSDEGLKELAQIVTERRRVRQQNSDLLTFQARVQAEVTYALTPTFVPEHAFKKLKAIARLCGLHQLGNETPHNELQTSD